MEPLPALCFTAALMSAICAFLGVSDLNLTLICTAIICLAGLLFLRRPYVPLERIAPPPLPPSLPEPVYIDSGTPDRFGGLEPDRLQSDLMRRMVHLEQVLASSKPRD